MRPRKCKCGAALKDARAEFCDTCRGARVKDQENRRKQKQLAELDDIDWDFVALAVRMKLEEIRANDKRVDKLVMDLAAEQCGAPASVIPAAMNGRQLRPENFRRLLTWLDRDADEFRCVVPKGRAA